MAIDIKAEDLKRVLDGMGLWQEFKRDQTQRTGQSHLIFAWA